MRTEKIHNLTLHHCDCMEYMRSLPDNAFELAIVDPPYGIGADSGQSGKGRISHAAKDWDSSPPSDDYFKELFRVSKNQIIWGGNYFTETTALPASMGWIFWDKDNHKFSLSDGELAWSSFNCKLRVFKRFANLDRGFMAKSPQIHPTQKPVKLYEWLLANYAKEGDRILDTHLGSGSHAIAAHYGGFEFVGCELDEDYYQAAFERVKRETAQVDMFGGAA